MPKGEHIARCQDGSIDVEHYINLGRLVRSAAASACFRRLKGQLNGVLARRDCRQSSVKKSPTSSASSALASGRM